MVEDNDETGAEMLKYVETVFSELRQFVHADILSELTRLRSLNCHIACRVRFVKHIVDGDNGADRGFTSVVVCHGRCHKPRCLLADDDLDELIDAFLENIADSVSR